MTRILILCALLALPGCNWCKVFLGDDAKKCEER